jgi:hypothetical protein
MTASLLHKWLFAQAVVADAGLSGAACRVAVALLGFHNGITGRCDPSYETIAKAAGLARRQTVIDAVADLERAGWITRKRRGSGKPGRSHTNAFMLRFERAEKSKENAPFSAEKGTENARKGTENVTQTLEEHPVCKTGGDDESGASLAAARPGGRPRGSALDLEGSFVEFWKLYPKRIGQFAAQREFTALVETGKASVAQILHGARRYAEERKSKPAKYTKAPAKWLADGDFLNEPQAADDTKPHPRKAYARKASLAEEALKAGGLMDGDDE